MFVRCVFCSNCKTYDNDDTKIHNHIQSFNEKCHQISYSIPRNSVTFNSSNIDIKTHEYQNYGKPFSFLSIVISFNFVAWQKSYMIIYCVHMWFDRKIHLMILHECHDKIVTLRLNNWKNSFLWLPYYVL